MTLMTRSVIVVPAAAVAAGLIFLGMVWLVATDDVSIGPDRPHIPDVTYTPPPIIDTPPDEIEKPTPPVVNTPKTTMPPPTSNNHVPIGNGTPTANLPPTIGIPTQMSSTLLPMVTVAPVYPERAKRRGIEGYVDVVFDVDARGRTFNCRILEARTATGGETNVFNRAACAAVEQFRFRVPTRNGEAQISTNQRKRFTFDLND